jgi:hypothetical protein
MTLKLNNITIEIYTMKSLRQYLTEDRKIYSFKIRLAVEPTSDLLDRVEKVLGKFDLVSLSKPKRAPIQAHPAHFHDLENVAVWTMDAELNYPANAEMVQNAIYSLGVANKYISVMNNNQEDDCTQQAEELAMVVKDSPSLLKDLASTKQKTNDDFAKETEKTVQNSVTGKIKVPGAPKKAQTTNDLPQGRVSPVGSTKMFKPEPKSARR